MGSDEPITPVPPVPDTVYGCLQPMEEAAARAYLEAYRAEWMRVYDPEHAAERARQVYWAQLAHTAGVIAAERVGPKGDA